MITSDDAYAAIRSAHPKPDWRRLRRALRLPGGAQFEGPAGEQHFAQQDHLHAVSGVDYVAHLEQMRARSAAVQAAQAAGHALDEALQGSTPSERKRLLDQAVRDAHRILDGDDRDYGEQGPRAAGGGTVRHTGLYPVSVGER